MPVEMIDDNRFRYSLVSYDADGVERPEAGASFSDEVVRAVAHEPITDVILLSHGWNGDVRSARDQYQRWIGCMLDCTRDRDAIAGRVPGFRPLVVGLHWPSKAWGDEELGGDGSFGTTAGPSDGAARLETLVELYAERLSQSHAALSALRTIFEAALKDIVPDTLPPRVAEAYAVLDDEIGLGADGDGAQPGADREPFDPAAAYEDVLEEEDLVSYGGGTILGGLLAPLRTLTFWHMKRRACRFGETGAASLLRRLRSAIPDGRDVRFHLMGHSFGCIVASACVAGGPEDSSCPVDTLVLAQGALSLWSYCSSIPSSPERAGYFRRVVADGLVRGSVVATMSEHDRAVGIFYPLGATAGRQLSYRPGELPKYGGLGAFGARGPLPAVENLGIGGVSEPYDFKPGTIYNLESSHVIANGGGASGAHSDICHAEIAHAVWSAISVGTAEGT